jgi:hypothetical protein
MMSPQESEAYARELQRLQRSPRHVKAAAGFAALLGVVILIRILATAHARGSPFGQTALFGLLAVAVFVSTGAALHERKRWAYVGIAILAALPLLNLLATSVHLLRLILERAAALKSPETFVSVVALCQLVVTCVFFRHLLASETRKYVWKTPADENLKARESIGED